MKTILITGANGKVGTIITHELIKQKEYHLKLTDLKQQDLHLQEDMQIIPLDISDFTAVLQIMQGVDCVIHLAGIASEASWDKLEAINVHGTYNILEAAKLNKVGKVILASSNQAIGFYRTNTVIDHVSPPRPASFYGVSKVCMEALGRLYADKFNLSVACIRIGSLEEKPTEVRHLSTWLSNRDLVHLINCALKATYHFIVVYGVSANTRSLWKNPDAQIIGYIPQDNAETYIKDHTITETRDDIACQFHGGQFCSENFSGNLSKID